MGAVNVGFAGHHTAMQIMAVVVLVVINGEAARIVAEQLDEGGIGAAGKGSAEHGIHDLHLHFVDNAVGRPGRSPDVRVGNAQWHMS